MRDGGDRGRRRMRMRRRPAAAARTEVDAPFGHAVGAGALRPALRKEERTDVTRRTRKVVSFRFAKLFMEPAVYVARTKGPRPYYVLHPNNRLRTLLSYHRGHHVEHKPLEKGHPEVDGATSGTPPCSAACRATARAARTRCAAPSRA